MLANRGQFTPVLGGQFAWIFQAVSWIGDFEQTAAELAIAKKYDYVICGHIHQPQMKTVETKEGSVVYLNSGDWIENLTALEFQDNAWSIYQYNEKDFLKQSAQVIAMQKKRPTLNVLTDEVSFFLNSLSLQS